MKRPEPSIAQLLAIVPFCVLGACGGGTPNSTPNSQAAGGTSPNQTVAPAPAPNSAPAPSPTPAPGPIPISGTVASGAPVVGAVITMTDATGSVVGSATSSGTGTFTITPSLNAVPPFVMTAVAPSSTLVAFVPGITTPVANITSVSNLAASLLSSNGSPQQLAVDVTNNPMIVSPAAVQGVENQINALLQPLTTAIGVPNADLLYGSFTADGSGVDLVLDSLDITIRPSGASANIQVTIREALPDGASPTALNFSSSAPPATVSYSVSSADLAPSGLSTQIQTLLNAATACWALPTPASVSAMTPGCNALFYQSNPSNFLNSGSTVGPGGAFSGLFSGSAMGQVFSEPTYLYSRAVTLFGTTTTLTAPVIRYKTTLPNGTFAYAETTVAEVNGAVTFLGDQYQYAGSVRGLGQLREYVNAPAQNYVGTGVTVNVTNTTSGGVPIFQQVVATSSFGTFTLTPNSSLSYLALTLPGGTAQSSTDIIRLADAYVSSATQASANAPSTYSPSLYFVSPILSDAQIAMINDQTSWELDYYLAGNTSATPDAIQYYRTEERPMTIAELTAYAPNLPTITSPSVAALIAATVGTPPNQEFLPPPTGPLTIGWSTPVGSPVVKEVGIYGYFGGVLFDDYANPSPGAVTVADYCSAKTVGDLHCSSGSWAAGATFDGIQFQTSDAAGQSLDSFFFVSNLY